MSRRNDLYVRIALLGAALAIGGFIVVRARARTEAPPPPPAPSPSPTRARTVDPGDPARDAYRALLLKVTAFMDEHRYEEACEALDAFAREHPGTRWSQVATLNRARLQVMKVEVDEREREESLERLEADLALLTAAGRFEEAIGALDDVPPEERDERWDELSARVKDLQEKARRAAEATPAEHPERAALSKLADEAESLARQGDHAAAREAAAGLVRRLERLDVPELDEEFEPRALAVLELASLAEIGAVLPGGAPAEDLSRLTPRDRIHVLSSRRDALVGFLQTLPRLDQIRVSLRKRLREARREALGIIFNKAIYPDEGHGAAGQQRVDDAVLVVRTIWERPLDAATEIDPVVRQAVEALRRANQLLSQDRASDARPIERVLAPLQERYSVRELAVEEGEEVLLRRNRVVKAFNDSVPTSLTKDERQLLDHVNGYREMMGLRMLEIEERLVMAARWHSTDMHEKKYFSHVDLEGRNPLDRAVAMMYPRVAVGENCATGLTDPARVHAGFYASSGHHRGMLMRGWNHVGIGRAGQYWTENFGSGPPQAR